MKLSNFVDINPRTSIPKGTIAEFVPMERIQPSNRYVTPVETKEYKGGAKFFDGDTLFARITPCLENGKIAQFKAIAKDSAAFGSTEYWVFRAKDGISDPSYVYYLSLSDILRKPAVQSMVGASGRQRAQIESIQGIDIGSVLIETQQKIGHILSAYDDLITINLKRISVLENMARLMYRERLEHPKGTVWETMPLSAISSLIGRGISPKYDKNGDSIVLNQRCIRDQKIELSNARNQSKIIPKQKLVCNGDVLINSTGVGTLGRVAQVEGHYKSTTVDSHVTIVRANIDIDYYFFGMVLLDKQPEFERLGTGATGQTELGREAIGRVVIKVPPKECRDKIGRQLKPIRQLVINLQNRNIKLQQSRDLLLPRLLSGELEV